MEGRNEFLKRSPAPGSSLKRRKRLYTHDLVSCYTVVRTAGEWGRARCGRSKRSNELLGFLRVHTCTSTRLYVSEQLPKNSILTSFAVNFCVFRGGEIIVAISYQVFYFRVADSSSSFLRHSSPGVIATKRVERCHHPSGRGLFRCAFRHLLYHCLRSVWSVLGLRLVRANCHILQSRRPNLLPGTSYKPYIPQVVLSSQYERRWHSKGHHNCDTAV